MRCQPVQPSATVAGQRSCYLWLRQSLSHMCGASDWPLSQRKFINSLSAESFTHIFCGLWVFAHRGAFLKFLCFPKSWCLRSLQVFVVGAVIYSVRDRALRAERELAEVRQAVIRILATPNQRSTDWVEQRKLLAQLLGQGNTYSTWSLSLAGMLDEPLLHGGGGDGGTGRLKVTPASLGVTATSTPEFLKALDLGGGDQRTIATHLVNGDIDQARAVLVDNKKGDANRCYTTGGDEASRQAANLRARFPEMTFTAIDPEDEERDAAGVTPGDPPLSHGRRVEPHAARKGSRTPPRVARRGWHRLGAGQVPRGARLQEMTRRMPRAS